MEHPMSFVETTRFLRQDLPMEDSHQAAVRARLEHYLRENRRGGVKNVVEESGLARQTISGFAGGAKCSSDTAEAIKSALDALEAVDIAMESPALYGSVDTDHIIGGQLRSVAALVESNSPGITKQIKARALVDLAHLILEMNAAAGASIAEEHKKG